MKLVCTDKGNTIEDPPAGTPLEQQFDNESVGQHSFMQVSNGFAYRYRLSAASGQRVDPMSIRINGRAILPGEKVRVAVSDFLATGGGAFMDPRTRERIAERGVSVWFDADHETLFKRVRRKSDRPLLHTADPESIAHPSSKCSRTRGCPRNSHGCP